MYNINVSMIGGGRAALDIGENFHILLARKVR